jgi:hypothetical protein
MELSDDFSEVTPPLPDRRTRMSKDLDLKLNYADWDDSLGIYIYPRTFNYDLILRDLPNLMKQLLKGIDIFKAAFLYLKIQPPAHYDTHESNKLLKSALDLVLETYPFLLHFRHQLIPSGVSFTIPPKTREVDYRPTETLPEDFYA